MTRPTDGPSRRDDRPRRSSGGDGQSRTLGLTPPVAGALSYSLTFVTGIVFYLFADDRFVRFHAAQSTLVFGLLVALNVVLSALVGLVAFVPGVGGVLARIVGAAAALTGAVGLVLWIALMYLAVRGTEYAVPVVGEWARRLA
ncbi:DUF4870 domain-containing protein [Halobellus ruber]|uniref:DUF4870 domain-containing protein n=1 Tax=Halobellus ruber TaxID=2761102 RepID=A0A7J9SLA7_9EURY|nr:hypothetical protein [Halobellus ruber]MBB6647302.1 hypothetical protein [Halobellus ruber]